MFSSENKSDFMDTFCLKKGPHTVPRAGLQFTMWPRTAWNLSAGITGVDYQIFLLDLLGQQILPNLPEKLW